MFNRNTFLLVLNESEENWCKRYPIEAFESPCMYCGRMFHTSIPFAKGDLRGLIAPICECGNEDTPFCLIRDPKKGTGL